MKKFYRYDTKYYASLDEYENASGSYPQIELHELYLVKETEKCWRIAYDWDTNLRATKLVRKNARKKFAYPSKEEAANSFLIRKSKQLRILTEKLKRAEAELNIAMNLNKKYESILTL
jgi:hypothetical protein